MVVANTFAYFLRGPSPDPRRGQFAFGGAAAIVESTPQNPIGSLDRFPDRKITKANARAEALGITAGMDVRDAFELIA